MSLSKDQRLLITASFIIINYITMKWIGIRAQGLIVYIRDTDTDQ